MIALEIQSKEGFIFKDGLVIVTAWYDSHAITKTRSRDAKRIVRINTPHSLNGF